MIAFCFEVHEEYINALCGQNVEFMNVKPDGTYSNHWALKLYNKADFLLCYSVGFIVILSFRHEKRSHKTRVISVSQGVCWVDYVYFRLNVC
jgi:hypothetical protein